MTAAIGLYKRLALPQPWSPTDKPTPLIIYGAASAVGAFGLKLAVQSNIHPILCVAGRGADFVRSIPGYDESKGDAIVDYRQEPAEIVAGLKKALEASGAEKVSHALDATSEHGSYENICKVLEPHGHVTTVLPIKEGEKLPQTMVKTRTMVGDSHGDAKDFANAYFRHFAYGLKNGSFSAHPYEVRKGGLGAVESALTDLKNGKASAVKYVFKISETEGAGKD
jgi:NADPH2:quinone reductase